MKLTGLVIATDEERDLPRCLEALSFCDERLVIDGGSSDRTVEVARAAGARVAINPWPGYAAQRRFGLEASEGEWVLAVDADEVVDARLREAILKEIHAPGSGRPAGFRVRVQAHLAGRRLRFGGVGHDDHLRLLRRDRAAVVSRAVHEFFAVDGEQPLLPGALIHHSFADLSEALQKADRYSTLAAGERFAKGQRISRPVAALRLPWSFLRRYVLFLGFLDGYAGFVHAALQAHVDFLKGAKLRELMEREPAAGISPRRPG
jgi:glycosyltransferase involved in cell wall biosynthesis